MSVCELRVSQDGRMMIVTAAGNVARTTDSQQFITTDKKLALESLEFLNQDVPLGGKREGTDRMKSMWGTFG